jgi:adenosylcobyric acid synthase
MDAALKIAVVAYPRMSNLDEFQPLKNLPNVALSWAREAAQLQDVDWIILPGSKHTSSDLAWLKQRGLAQAIVKHAYQGGRVLGVCGGLQMLGQTMVDAHGVDGCAQGLGLLELATHFAKDKVVRHTERTWGQVHGVWSALSQITCAGYEIHHGQTVLSVQACATHEVMPQLAWQNAAGNVLGVYLHGLLEDARVLQALFGQADGEAVPSLDTVFDGLADYVAQHSASGFWDGLLTSEDSV